MARLNFPQNIKMDGHTDFFMKNLTWMAIVIFPEKSAWMAILIFSQKINMDGHVIFRQKINMESHADFSIKKFTWLAMQIFT